MTFIKPLLFLAIATSTLAQSSFCPAREKIAPCTCSPTGMVIYDLTCDGPTITQENIVNMMDQVRSQNGLSIDDHLHLWWLQIKNTQLNDLDLFPFFNLDVDILELTNNTQLTNFYTSNSTTNANHFTPEIIGLNDNHLTDADLLPGGKITKLFDLIDPTKFKSLNLANNQIEGNPQGGEVIPGLLARFPNINVIYAHNKIKGLSHAPLENYTRVGVINFWDNGMTFLGEEAFKFNLAWTSPDGYRQIFLEDNFLHDDVISATAFTEMNAPVYLKLDRNQFDYISAEKFKPFLDFVDNHGRQGKLSMDGNPIFCDQRSKWLKDEVGTYHPRVTGMMCVNDVGFSVFNSTLV